MTAAPNAPAPPTTRATVELFFLITVEKEISGRFVKTTEANNIKVQPGTRTEDLYDLIIESQVPEPFRGGVVLELNVWPAVITSGFPTA